MARLVAGQLAWRGPPCFGKCSAAASSKPHRTPPPTASRATNSTKQRPVPQSRRPHSHLTNVMARVTCGNYTEGGQGGLKNEAGSGSAAALRLREYRVSIFFPNQRGCQLATAAVISCP